MTTLDENERSSSLGGRVFTVAFCQSVTCLSVVDERRECTSTSSKKHQQHKHLCENPEQEDELVARSESVKEEDRHFR